MRKVDVVRPPINYVVISNGYKAREIAWFIDEDDAKDFLSVMTAADQYEIAEVRR